jgi:hypothetical protein
VKERERERDVVDQFGGIMTPPHSIVYITDDQLQEQTQKWWSWSPRGIFVWGGEIPPQGEMIVRKSIASAFVLIGTATSVFDGKTQNSPMGLTPNTVMCPWVKQNGGLPYTVRV